MSATPKPPSKKLLFGFGLTTGVTTGMWAIIGVGYYVFSGIPANRMPWYIAAGLIGILASGYLGTRYAIQKQRRDAWWEGFAAGDEPGAEVVQLNDFRRSDRDTRGTGTGSLGHTE